MPGLDRHPRGDKALNPRVGYTDQNFILRAPLLRRVGRTKVPHVVSLLRDTGFLKFIQRGQYFLAVLTRIHV